MKLTVALIVALSVRFLELKRVKMLKILLEKKTRGNFLLCFATAANAIGAVDGIVEDDNDVGDVIPAAAALSDANVVALPPIILFVIVPPTDTSDFGCEDEFDDEVAGETASENLFPARIGVGFTGY